LLIYIVVVFIGGALLAPWVYWLAHHFSSIAPALATVSFNRFVRRCLLGVALIGLWPLLRNLGATSLRDVGLDRPSSTRLRSAGKGWLLGLALLGFVAGIAVIFGARHLNTNLGAIEVVRKFGEAALTACAVAVLEEILFRGGVFGGLRRVFDWRFALLTSSLIYAIVHFLARTTNQESVYWWSGLKQLGLMLAGFTHLQELVPGFFNLTIAGVLLGLAFYRTGDLYFSIGMHAGWIFCLKSYSSLTVAGELPRQWWCGTFRLIDGWLAMAVLGAALFAFARMRVDRGNQWRL
jgi:membrane protease YdiL (CAAX protease family)